MLCWDDPPQPCWPHPELQPREQFQSLLLSIGPHEGMVLATWASKSFFIANLICFLLALTSIHLSGHCCSSSSWLMMSSGERWRWHRGQVDYLGAFLWGYLGCFQSCSVLGCGNVEREGHETSSLPHPSSLFVAVDTFSVLPICLQSLCTDLSFGKCKGVSWFAFGTIYKKAI